MNTNRHCAWMFLFVNNCWKYVFVHFKYPVIRRIHWVRMANKWIKYICFVYVLLLDCLKASSGRRQNILRNCDWIRNDKSTWCWTNSRKQINYLERVREKEEVEMKGRKKWVQNQDTGKKRKKSFDELYKIHIDGWF